MSHLPARNLNFCLTYKLRKKVKLFPVSAGLVKFANALPLWDFFCIPFGML